MSIDIRSAPDLRVVAMDWLRQEYPDLLGTRNPGTVDEVLLVRTETPPDVRLLLEDYSGVFVRVGQLPGRSTRHEVTAALDFDVFGLTDAEAGDLARDIDARLGRGWARVVESGASLQNVTNQMSPVTVPWADASVRRYLSNYAVTARR